MCFEALVIPPRGLLGEASEGPPAYPRSLVVSAMMGPAMEMTTGGNIPSRKMVVSSCILQQVDEAMRAYF